MNNDIILTMKNTELNITTPNKSTGLRKWITLNSAHSKSIYELTWDAYFHKSMQLAIPCTYRHVNLLNLTLNAYRHGCTIDWIRHQLRSSMHQNADKYSIPRHEIHHIYHSTLFDFYRLRHTTHTPYYWHSSPSPITLRSNLAYFLLFHLLS